jgi:hypothetical protein
LRLANTAAYNVRVKLFDSVSYCNPGTRQARCYLLKMRSESCRHHLCSSVLSTYKPRLAVAVLAGVAVSQTCPGTNPYLPNSGGITIEVITKHLFIPMSKLLIVKFRICISCANHLFRIAYAISIPKITHLLSFSLFFFLSRSYSSYRRHILRTRNRSA